MTLPRKSSSYKVSTALRENNDLRLCRQAITSYCEFRLCVDHFDTHLATKLVQWVRSFRRLVVIMHWDDNMRLHLADDFRCLRPIEGSAPTYWYQQYISVSDLLQLLFLQGMA